MTWLLKAKPRASQASNPMRAIVGLRNPGPDYEGTRHNSGFEVVSEVLARSGEKWGRAPSRVRAQISQFGVGDDRAVFAAPVTFMNESGPAVRGVLAYFNVPIGDLLVVHDDIDLPFGRLKLQIGGGSGGHNGIRSIETALGTNEFSRLKFGVGRPPARIDPADFVLRRFTKTEEAGIESMVDDAADVVEKWLTDPVKAQEIAALRGKTSSD